MSYSDVDSAADPDRLVELLDVTARRLAPVKALLRNLARPTARRPVLDLGCGTGFDLVALADDGCDAVGVDPSRVMLDAAGRRCRSADAARRLAAGLGQDLPFRSGSFGGCIADRVLQHVARPEAVLAEARRVLVPGGVLAVFEPDWDSLTLDASDRVTAAAVTSQVVAGVAHRRIGMQLRALLAAAGFADVVVAPDTACATSLEHLRRLANIELAADRAVAASLVSRPAADALLGELADRSESGTFTAVMNRYIAAGSRPEAGPAQRLGG